MSPWHEYLREEVESEFRQLEGTLWWLREVCREDSVAASMHSFGPSIETLEERRHGAKLRQRLHRAIVGPPRNKFCLCGCGQSLMPGHPKYWSNACKQRVKYRKKKENGRNLGSGKGVGSSGSDRDSVGAIGDQRDSGDAIQGSTKDTGPSPSVHSLSRPTDAVDGWPLQAQVLPNELRQETSEG